MLLISVAIGFIWSKTGSINEQDENEPAVK